MTEIVSFGEWVQKRRGQLGLTRTVLSKQIGCAPITIKKIERDERRPSEEMAELFAQYLQIPKDQKDDFVRRARGEYVANMAGPDQLPIEIDFFEQAQAYTIQAQFWRGQFIGRQAELTEIQNLLQNDKSSRLLTLVGAGGIGKTYLALEAARNSTESFTDGVCFVPLTPLTDASFLLNAIINGLNLSISGEVDQRQQLCRILTDKNLLIVLDNFEHLLLSDQHTADTEISLLSEILRAAPNVKLLVTSRERLNLAEEWAVDIMGLPFPDQRQETLQTGIEELISYPAMALFNQRARQAKRDFKITPENISAILDICLLVNGLPLGIEMAAAWVRLLSCQEIATEIARSFDFLTTAQRELPQRQKSFRAVFEYSWRLLDESERQLLSQLSVFRGGFERNAAEQICDATLFGLLSLVDKSLLQRSEDGRFDLHELLRQFAAEKLDEDPSQLKNTLEKHSHFYLNQFFEIESKVKSGQVQFATGRIRLDSQNFRQAWRNGIQWGYHKQIALAIVSWSHLQFGSIQHLAAHFKDAIIILSKIDLSSHASTLWHKIAYGGLLGSFGWMQQTTGNTANAREHFRLALSILTAFEEGEFTSEIQKITATQLLVNTYASQCAFDAMTADYALGYEAAERGLEACAKIESPTLWGWMYTSKGLVAEYDGNWDLAEKTLEAGLEYFETTGIRTFVGSQCLISLGRTMLFKGNYNRSEAILMQSIDIRQEMNDLSGLAFSFTALGELAEAQGEFADALSYHADAVRYSETSGSLYATSFSLAACGRVAAILEDWPLAIAYSERAILICKSIGDQVSRTLATNNLGQIALKRGDNEAALTYFKESLRLVTSVSIDFMAADMFLGFAEFSILDGELETAQKLLASIAQFSGFSHHYRTVAKKRLDELLKSNKQIELIQDPPITTLDEMAAPFL